MTKRKAQAVDDQDKPRAKRGKDDDGSDPPRSRSKSEPAPRLAPLARAAERTVYDAVADKIVNTQRFTLTGDYPYRLFSAPIAADDYLHRKEPMLPEVPVVYRSELPDGQLLEALHWYVGEYYKLTGQQQMFKQLDETALLALGIVVEEYLGELLGRHGHLTYAELDTDTPGTEPRVGVPPEAGTAVAEASGAATAEVPEAPAEHARDAPTTSADPRRKNKKSKGPARARSGARGQAQARARARGGRNQNVANGGF